MVPPNVSEIESRQASNSKAMQFFIKLTGQDFRGLPSGFSKPNAEVSPWVITTVPKDLDIDILPAKEVWHQEHLGLMEKSEMEASEEPLAQPLFWWWKHLLCSFDQQVLTVPNFTPFICMINENVRMGSLDAWGWIGGHISVEPHWDTLTWFLHGEALAQSQPVCIWSAIWDTFATHLRTLRKGVMEPLSGLKKRQLVFPRQQQHQNTRELTGSRVHLQKCQLSRSWWIPGLWTFTSHPFCCRKLGCGGIRLGTGFWTSLNLGPTPYHVVLEKPDNFCELLFLHGNFIGYCEN